MQRRSLVVLALFTLSTVFSSIPLPLFTPVALAAPVTILSDGFGTGGTDTTFNEAPAWTEGGDGATKQTSGSGNDSASPNGSRFALVEGKDGYICITVNMTGYDTVQLSYYWRGDSNAESSDSGIVEFKSASGNSCSDSSGWTNLQNHNMDVDSSWSTQSAFTNAGFNDTSFLLRFRNDSSSSSEDFRVDGVSVTGEAIVTTGTLHVIKNTIGGDDTFNFTGAATFDITTSGGTGTHNITDLEAGTYSVDETPPAGWQVANNGCQDVSVTAGETTECTITNTKAATVTIIKQTEGSDGEFSFEGPDDEEYSIETEEGEGEHVTSVFPDEEGSEYSVSESVPEGWDLTNLSCENVEADIDSNTASFTLEPGDEVTCTFTNTQKGTLHIIKELVDYGEEDEGDLEFSVDIDEVGSYSIEVDPEEGEGSIDVQLAPGEYEVSENDLPEGWMLAENGCEEVTVESGETTNCTIVNKKISHVHIIKTAIGDSGTFTFSGLGEEDINVEADQEDEEESNHFMGDSFFDVFVDLEGEDFTVTEELPEDSLWVQTNPEGNCDVTNLLPGQTQTCEFTNVKKATIVVMKETTGGDGTFSISSSNEDIESFDLTTEEGQAEKTFTILLEEETEISFQEVDLPDEWVGSPDFCTVEVGPGDTVICTLGNIKKARLIVEKDTIGGDGTFSFETSGFEARDCENEEEECNTHEFSLETNEDSHHADTFFDIFVEGDSLDVSVAEQEQERWQAIGNSSCSVTLAPGEVKTCSFVNAKSARLTVTKTTVNDTGTFHFTGIGPEQGFDLTTVEQNSPVQSFFDIFVDLDEGTSVTVQESSQEGWNADQGSCQVTLHPGDEETCAFVNTRQIPPAQEDGNEGNDQQNPNDEGSGGSSGNGSRTEHAKAEFLAHFHGVGNLPPGAFGAGPELPLSEDEVSYICSMQRSLPPIPPLSLVETIGTYMAELMGRDPAFIIEQLQDPFLCEGINEALNTAPKTIAELPIPFPLGSDGLPVSRNLTWNACIRDQVTLDIIRSNPDRDDDSVPRTCADYHTHDIWRHPDLAIDFILHRSPLRIELPPGYVFFSKPGIKS